jgi:hypothetical protein
MAEEDDPAWHGHNATNVTFLGRLLEKAHHPQNNTSPLCRCRDLVGKMKRHGVCAARDLVPCLNSSPGRMILICVPCGPGASRPGRRRVHPPVWAVV